MTIGPGFLQKASNLAAAFLGVVDVADRGREAVGPEALDFIEGKLRTRGDDEIVISDRGAVGGFDRIVLRRHFRHRARLETDAAFGESRREIDLQGFALAPADRNPGVRRNEVIQGILGDAGQPVLRTHLAFHLVGHDRAAQAPAHDDDIGHSFLPNRRARLLRASLIDIIIHEYMELAMSFG